MWINPLLDPRIIFLGLISGLGGIAVDFFLPASELVANDFGLNSNSVSLNTSTFLIGMALGQLIGGALSDLYGRRPIIIGGVLVFVVGSALSSSSANLTELLLFRNLQAVGAGVLSVVVNALLSDGVTTSQTARSLSLVTSASIGLRLLAPLGAALLLLHFQWQLLQQMLCLIGLLSFLVLILNPNMLSENMRPISVAQAVHLLRDKSAPPELLYFGLIEVLASTALFTIVVTLGPLLFDYLGVSTTEFGVVLSGITLWLMACSVANRKLLDRNSPHSLLRLTQPWMLIASCAGLLVLTFYSLSQSLLVCTVLLALYLFGVQTTRLNALAICLKSVPEMAGTTATLIGTMGMTTGAIIGGILSYNVSFNPFDLGAALFAVSLAAMILLFASNKSTALQ